MKRILPWMAFVLLFAAACKKTMDTVAETPVSEEPVSVEQINVFIRATLQTEHKFEWSKASDVMVWSALKHSDGIMSVGYKPSSVAAVNEIHTVNINDAEWKAAKQQVLDLILASEQKLDKNIQLKDIVQWEENVLPVIDIKVKNLETVKLLRASNLIRYAEPMGYEPAAADAALARSVLSSSGCGNNVGETNLIANVDYTTITPNTKQSWNHSYHKISQAWTKSSGAGTKIFIIDTGCENDQENLGSAFNQGLSSGRTISKLVTLPRSTFLGFPTGPVETSDDGCGHGTSMAGAAAAPRGTDGAAVGVAYNSNLVTCRAAEDVFIDGSREVKGVSDAFTTAANIADVKIISMSMGKITSASQITDAINYAYGKGKLIFCAAGTSFSWTSSWFGVIFPAYLSTVNAVTGVRDNNFKQSCTDCHDGSETDFTIVMEKASNERHPLTLAMSGDVPSTVGGSSVSTATMAGIAALVWSRFPGYTRDQVLNKLIQNCSNYPSKSSSLGWGNVNADGATN